MNRYMKVKFDFGENGSNLFGKELDHSNFVMSPVQRGNPASASNGISHPAVTLTDVLINNGSAETNWSFLLNSYSSLTL